MAREMIKIEVNLVDKFSPGIKTMRDSAQKFNKELNEMYSGLKELNKMKITLKADMGNVKSELKAAEDQLFKTGKAADILSSNISDIDYGKASQNLSLLYDKAKDAEKGMKNLADTISKFENRPDSDSKNQNAEGISLNSLSSGGSEIISSLAEAGAAAIIGDLLGEVVTTQLSSKYGSNVGTMASSVLSFGVSGAAIGMVAGPAVGTTLAAAIGTAIAPGIGTAVAIIGGTLIGALAGYIKGKNKIFEKDDDAFRSYYQELYDTSLEKQQQILANGASGAAKRETDEKIFGTLLGGRGEYSFQKSLIRFGIDTSFNYEELSDISKTLLKSGFEKEEILPLLTKVGDAGAALGMSTEEIKQVAVILGRMQTSGNVTIDDLNALQGLGIHVSDYLEEYFTSLENHEKSGEEDSGAAEKKLSGEEALTKITNGLVEDYTGKMGEQMKTYEGLTSTLEESEKELKLAMESGYMNTRKNGLQKQVDFFNGETGNEMKDAYGYIGQWQAYQENKEEEIERDVMTSVMTGTLAKGLNGSEQKESIERLMREYRKAEEEYEFKYRSHDEEGALKATAEMGRILAEAQAIAINEYNASDAAQTVLESNQTLAKRIRYDSNIKQEYWNAGNIMGKEFEKGMKAAIDDVDMSYISPPLPTPPKPTPEPERGSTARPEAESNGIRALPAYTTVSYVPYDNYDKKLLEGDGRGWITSGNRNYSGNSPINITGNTFVVRSEEDIKDVAEEIANLMKQAYVLTI